MVEILLNVLIHDVEDFCPHLPVYRSGGWTAVMGVETAPMEKLGVELSRKFDTTVMVRQTFGDLQRVWWVGKDAQRMNDLQQIRDVYSTLTLVRREILPRYINSSEDAVIAAALQVLGKRL